MIRKIILLGVLVLGLQTVGFSVNRERREPCAPYDNERTLSQVEEILLRDGVYYENLRYEVARVYNSIADYRVSATKDGMREMLAHSVLVESSFFVPEEFENGVKVGNRIEYTNLIGRESKYWIAAADENGKPIDGYMKVNCLNIQKRKHLLTRGKEKLREAVVIDTIRKTTHIYDTICHIEYLPYQTQQEPMFAVMLSMEMGYQQPYPQYIPMQPIYYGESGGDYTNIVNNYTYNNTTNNYYKPPKPDPEKPGGPVDPTGHTNGPAHVDGHDDVRSTSSQNGGSPRRNVPSGNYEETFTNKARSLEKTTAPDNDALASTSRDRISNENFKNPNSNARSNSSQSNDYEKEWERKNQERAKASNPNTRKLSPAPKQRESITDFGNSRELNKRPLDSKPNQGMTRTTEGNPRTPQRVPSTNGKVENHGITKAAGVGNGRTSFSSAKTTPPQNRNVDSRPTNPGSKVKQTPPQNRPVNNNGRYEQPTRKAERPSGYQYHPPQLQKYSNPAPMRSNSGGSPSYSPSRGSNFSGHSSGSHRSGNGRR